MRTFYLQLALLVTISSCASTTGVMPLGKDTYMVTSSSEFGLGHAQKAAIAEANEFAKKSGKQVVPLTAEAHTEKDFVGDSIRVYEFQFRLVDVNDPEWQRTHLAPAPDTLIEVRNNAASPEPAEPAKSTADVANELQRLQGLLDAGTINGAEFEILKARLFAE